MPQPIDMNDAFATDLLAKVSAWSGPTAYYNHDGDYIELMVSNESYRAQRLDSFVTVYVSRETGELVGALVKGLRRFVREILESAPGFKIEIADRKIRLKYLFTAGLWKRRDEPDGTVVLRYKQLRDVAEQTDLEIEMEPETV